MNYKEFMTLLVEGKKLASKETQWVGYIKLSDNGIIDESNINIDYDVYEHWEADSWYVYDETKVLVNQIRELQQELHKKTDRFYSFSEVKKYPETINDIFQILAVGWGIELKNPAWGYSRWCLSNGLHYDGIVEADEQLGWEIFSKYKPEDFQLYIEES